MKRVVRKQTNKNDNEQRRQQNDSGHLLTQETTT